MERRVAILLLTCLVCSSVLAVIDPRGPRPVEPGYKSDKCATQKEWAFCSDEDWGAKCPSGCRVLGLMDKHDHEMMKKITRIRTLLEKNQAQYGTTDHITKQTYDYLKEGLTTTAGGDNSYYEVSQKLRQRIVDMKIKIDRQLRLMSTMKEQIKNQVTEMQRMEVDVDMKLRGCKGSCKTHTEFSVDQASYVTLDKQMAQLDTDASQSVGPSRPLYVMKSRILKDQTVVDNRFKSKPEGGEQSDVTFFPEVQTMRLILEAEGSLTSPATVSKVPVCLQLKKRKHKVLDSQTYKRPACPHQYPMCTDEDWGSGCPSGCVLQVLFLQQEVEVEKRMLEVCKGLEQHHHTSLSTLSSATLLYHTQRHALISQHNWELWYVAGANRLASKLRLLRKLSAASSQKLKELRQKVQKQMEELYHTEVDVDIKIRACQGSCASRLAFRLQVEDQIALSPPTPPRRELPDIAPSTPQGQRKQLEHFGDIEEIQLVVQTPHLHPEHPDL